MELGGHDALTASQQPLTADIEAGQIGTEPTPQVTLRPPPSARRTAQSDRLPDARHNPLGESAAAGSTRGLRRLRASEPGIRRQATPIRTAEARNALQRSLLRDGTLDAICLAGELKLEKLAESLQQASRGADSSAGSGGPGCSNGGLILANGSAPKPEAAAPASSSSALPSAGGATAPSLGDAVLVRTFGERENLVLQLHLFSGKDLFVFRFGCLVCWDFDQQELASTKEHIRPFLARELPAADIEQDRMEFVIKLRLDEGNANEDDDDEELDPDDPASAGASAVRQDQIILTTTSPFERLAHAYAMAQSVRLGVFEMVVDRSIEKTRSIPEAMAETGEVNLDPRELSKKMGQLLMLRCEVNLHTDILDTPEIFWDEERFEPHYVACRGYLDVDKRVDILNQRLGVLKDLYDLLQNSLNVKHGNRLEYIIIILILVEVVLELLELVYDAWGH